MRACCASLVKTPSKPGHLAFSSAPLDHWSGGLFLSQGTFCELFRSLGPSAEPSLYGPRSSSSRRACASASFANLSGGSETKMASASAHSISPA